MLFYSLGLLAAIILASPYWLLRMAWSGRYRDGLGQRLGAVPRGLRKFVGEQPTIWIHAVSVGETMAIIRLVELLDELDNNFRVVISTTTRAGQQLAQQRFDRQGSASTRVFYYPLDFAWIVRRYLRALRPRAIILVESELWPRMLVEAARAEIPVVVVNGRISDRSLPRYLAARWLWRPFLRRLTLVLAQSEPDRKRFVAIGVPRDVVRTAGNLKYDMRIAAEVPVTRSLRFHLPEEAKIIVAGSTLEGEDGYLLDAFRELLAQFPRLVLILAPRHPERFRAVEELIQKKKFTFVLRSKWIQHPHPIAPGTVFLLDSMGELASVYSLASVAFVGGSLIPEGGHNPLEPAQFAVPIVTGSHTENFRGIIATLLERDAIRVTPRERLASLIGELLASSSAIQMGVRARQVFEEQAGASERCCTEIEKILAEDKSAMRAADFR